MPLKKKSKRKESRDRRFKRRRYLKYKAAANKSNDVMAGDLGEWRTSGGEKGSSEGKGLLSEERDFNDEILKDIQMI
ncbi:hypothetical protein Avbf_18724 [Armadillidium vulgare]|nr:hypothetical protein Avbf_18724 [Armadillidium vulgare]